MAKAKKWVKCKAFEGQVTQENFKLEEEELPALQDGGNIIFTKILKFYFWIKH